MLEPKKPADEKERMQSLNGLNMLDTPMDDRFERITRMVCLLLSVPISAFTLIDHERQWFKSIQGMTNNEGPRREAFCAHTILSEEMLVVPDTAKDDRFHDNPAVTGMPNIGFYAGCPVHAPDGRIVGSLCAADSKAREVSQDQLKILRDLTEMVESELKVAQLSKTQAELIAEVDQAHRLALIDSLTRLWNRAGIFEILNREWAEATRRHTMLGLVMGDIDHFKAINDTHGHPVGDIVLQEVAKRLVSAVRTEDVVGRLGGEEFLIGLPGCLPGALFNMIERIRATVSATPISTPVGDLNVTMSFGGSCGVPSPDSQITGLIKIADDALYRAKSGGRNRTEIASAT